MDSPKSLDLDDVVEIKKKAQLEVVTIFEQAIVKGSSIPQLTLRLRETIERYGLPLVAGASSPSE